VDRSRLVEASKVGCGRGYPLPAGEGVWGGAKHSPEIFLLFDYKMELFGGVFKLDLTEETDAIARRGGNSCLILAYAYG